MGSHAVPIKTIAVILFVFIVIVALDLAFTAKDNGNGEDEKTLRISSIQVRQDGRMVEIGPGIVMSPAELGQLMQGRIGLLASGQTNERRAAAIQLAVMTADSRERERLRQLDAELMGAMRVTLLKALNDPDAAVSSNSRDALIGLWRMSDSAAATDLFAEGIAYYDAGDLDRAMDTFDAVERLDEKPPLDLYRMKAEVYFARGQLDKALAECRRVVAADPQGKEFPTLLLLARIYHAQGQDETALRWLNGALSIYHGYPEALELQRQIGG